METTTRFILKIISGLLVEVNVVMISLLSVAEVVVKVRLRYIKTLECFISVLRQQQDDDLQHLRCFPVWARISRGCDRGRGYQIAGSDHSESRSGPARIGFGHNND